jgi:transcriptional regulator of arginine metabolism
MARNLRQSKIIEIISVREIETQDDLAAALKSAGFDITQATISRDIKELGLIKVVSQETKKSKYALIENDDNALHSKYLNIFREAVLSVKSFGNFVVLKILKGAGGVVSQSCLKMNIDAIISTAFDDESLTLFIDGNAEVIAKKINEVLYN